MLYVYKASAGSGKTHLLTGFYISLLFRRELTPFLDQEEKRDLRFSEILAVTFTNKATAEMKERIIAEIHKLSVDPRSSQYYDQLTAPDPQGRCLTDEAIRDKARRILRDMLLRYGDLHISTIDSFFQQVIRSFAHEMNLQGNYDVELDSDSVFDHAVSQFLLTLDSASDPETFAWLCQFANSRLVDGANWNPHADLYRLALQLTAEEYRQHAEQLKTWTDDKRQMRQYVSMLDGIKRGWRTELRQLGKEATALMAELKGRLNLSADDFSRKGAGVLTYLPKYEAGECEEVTSTMLKWSEDPTAWFTKSSPWQKSLPERDKARLQSVLERLVKHLSPEGMRQYVSAKIISQNFYQLGLLCRLREAADNYCAEQGVKLLSDTTQLLNELVRNRESPFIYEKTGTRIYSYMIDEFQDTSGIQWENFRPLLTDALGIDSRNLIVGDVKQSIYRWRGGDWRLLDSEIPAFLPDKQAFDERGNKLRDNWRSVRKIIDFNNSFFTEASQSLSRLDEGNPFMHKIADIYSDVEQTFPAARQDNGGGILHFEQLKLEKGESYSGRVRERLPQLVAALQRQGYKAGEILILCRKADECKVCAESLLSYKKAHPASPYKYDIITSEALKLKSRQVIRSLVAFLQYVHEPKSEARRCTAACCYYALTEGSMAAAVARWARTQSCPDFLRVLNLPLYEMVESLIEMLPPAARREMSFLNAFRDTVLEFCSRQGPSLDAFLKWWDEKSDKFSITTPEGQDAIRIMTIHKSKGLGEKAVIVPFAKGTMDIDGQHPSLLWCEPREKPFSSPGLVLPVRVDDSLQHSIFDREYDSERCKTIIDNLNTSYVAFTRAKQALVILSPVPAQKESKCSLETLLTRYFGEDRLELETAAAEAEESQAEGQVAGQSAGEGQGQVGNVNGQSGAESQGSKVKGQGSATDGQSQAKGKTSAKGKKGQSAVEGEDEPAHAPMPVIKVSPKVETDAIARGVTLHDALSAVHDSSDVERPIRQLFSSGRAEARGLTVDETIQRVQELIARAEVAEWFDPANRVLAERNIITRTTHTQRPDRIVFTPSGRVIIIDYKTGEEHPAQHRRQVSYYAKLMQEMGFGPVEAYLWYFEPHKIVRVV